MTVGDGVKSRRPSEEMLRHRLQARQAQHAFVEAERRRSLLYRLGFSRERADRVAPRVEDGAFSAMPPFARHHPILSFTAMSLMTAAVVGSGYLLTQTNTQTALEDNQVADAVTAASVLRPTKPIPAPLVADMPADGPNQRINRDMVRSDGKPISQAAVNAALALRFPTTPAASSPVANNQVEDHLMATGSIQRQSAGDETSFEEAGGVGERVQEIQEPHGVPGAIHRPDEVKEQDLRSEPSPTDGLAASAADPVADDGREAGAGSDNETRMLSAGTPAVANPDIRETNETRRFVTSNVNMREKPENDATILTVLTKGSSVAVLNCEAWCEVSADGRTGYVYRAFLSGES